MRSAAWMRLSNRRRLSLVSPKTIETEMTFSEQIVFQFSGKILSLVGVLGIRLDNVWTGSLAERLVTRLERELGQIAGMNDPRGIYYHCFCALP